MLLKVDVFPSDLAPSSAKKLKSPVPTMWTSLITSSSSTILTVGRKEGDVVLSKDKSVSRKQLNLVVKSTSEFEEGKGSPEKATSEDEINLCTKDPSSCCVVLTDSSRFGTYVAIEAESSRKDNKDDGSVTGDDDDETTDDEGGQSQQKKDFQVLSEVTKMIAPAAKLQKVEGEFLLESLFRNNRAIIQCGQNGSTIVLTRLRLKIAFSRIDKPTKDTWTKRFPYMGGEAIENLGPDLHCLVVSSRLSNAKNITAWSYQKPIVSVGYLEALWARSSKEEPLPSPFDFNETETPNGETFWDLTSNPNLWSKCTFYSYTANDMEYMVASAGAKVVRVYDDPNFKDLEVKNKNGAFFLFSTTSRDAKYVKLLKSKGIPFVKSQKKLAAALSQQELLVDGKGVTIGEATSPPSSQQPEEEEIEEGSPDPEARASAMTQRTKEMAQNALTQCQPEQLSPVREEQPSKRNRQREPEEDEVSQSSEKRKRDEPEEEPAYRSSKKNKRTQSEEKEPSQPSKKKKKVEPEEEAQDNDSPMSKDPPTPRGSLSQKNLPTTEGSSQTSRAKSQPSRESSTQASWQSTKKRNRREDESEEEPEEEEPRNKKSRPAEASQAKQVQIIRRGTKNLTKTSDGWFIAAPKGEKRKSYQNELEGELPPSIETDIIEGLVVEARKQNRDLPDPIDSSVPDYKGFRKNRVAIGTQARIVMRSVLPEESQRQRELQEEEEAVEESDRAAERLFHDDTGGGGGNIRSHFSKTTATKRRKRRAV